VSSSHRIDLQADPNDPMNITLALTLAALATFGAAAPENHKETPKQSAPAPVAAPSEAEIVKAQKPAYPLDACVVSGKKLDAKAIDVVVDGRLVRLCCSNCKGGLEKDKAAAFAKIDAGVIAAQKDAYPLATCPVSGEKLGGMGEPANVVHGTKLVRLCCSSCKKGFDKDPAASLAKVDKAWIDAQLPSYGLDTCPVSGEKLGGMGEPVNVLYGTKLVRLCCKSCTKALDKDGPAIVARIDAAKKK
jgi:hypothetical protein